MYTLRVKIRELALKAISKPSPYGPDIDISPYLKEYLEPSRTLKAEEIASLVGVELKPSYASAIYYQRDRRIDMLKSLTSCIDIKPIEEVEEEESKYLWNLVSPDTDKYVASVALYGKGGYFIRVKRGCKIELPIQTCFFMTGGAQLVHNVIVLEEGAEAVVVTGCTIMPESIGFHSAVTEIFLGPRAKLIDVMIHSWNHVTHVRPRTGVALDEEATYIAYYINMSKTKTIQTMPRIELRGNNARCYSASIVLGLKDGYYDVGTKAILMGSRSSAELVSKVIARDESRIVSRLRLDALGSRSKGYTECSALLLSDKAHVETIPELNSSTEDSELHHEASIGRIRDEEIEYLMLKGFDYREAVSLLIRGFVSVNLSFLPPRIRNSMDIVLKTLAERGIG